MNIGKLLIILGSTIAIIGVLISYAPWLFNWFGKLPGDIQIKNETTTIFIPITSMIVISLTISIIFNLFFRK